MDFGLGPASHSKQGKNGPEMSGLEKDIRGGHGRGISLETGSPYILPVGLHGSRESFHSLSRSQIDPHDPYRPVTFNNDNQSIRSQSRHRNDNGSLYTTSSGGTEKHKMNDSLLKNAQRMSTSSPMRLDSMTHDSSRSPDGGIPLSPLNPRFVNDPLPTVPAPVGAPMDFQLEHTTPKPSAVPSIQLPEPVAVNGPFADSSAYPPRIQSHQASVHEHANTASRTSNSSYGGGFQVTPPSPGLSGSHEHQQEQLPGLSADVYAPKPNRVSMSLRPLPMDEPEENPEQRANRIRSFYKEYFDESKPEPVGGHTYTDYYEDYGSEYQDGTVFDPRSGNFIVAQPNAPFAEPITRRAMTPPPRAPPRFRGGPGPQGHHGPHMSSGSFSSAQFPPRNNSSMSGRYAPSGPKKALPPPAALSSLPTPAKLSENSMVFDPIDFAPPVSFRDRQNGTRPDSPLGSPRPYSPSVRPHTPLVGSYDDLAVMPSPHLLRKSGTFTGLDFAPPPRFRDPGSNASDAGSIRSNRSGMSATGRFAVRSGANRVSRIPREVVGTRDDFMLQLRPQMNMVTKG